METSTKYPPIPEGAPFLFDDQDKPFAGDTFMERDFLALRDKYGLKTFVETGTCYASTALWAAEHFDSVWTVESHGDTFAVADKRLTGLENATWIKGRSELVMPHMIAIANAVGPILCFLDAHFDKHCPLLDELKAIAESGIKPVICVHDMFVPGRPDLGYDTWNGKRFTFEWLKPSLDRIYGPKGYSHWFNNEAAGQKRGCLYCAPL